MKLARKLTLAIMLGILVIMATAAATRVRRERALFELDMSRDHQFIGRALRDALVSIGQVEGVPRMEAIVNGTYTHDPRISVRVVTLTPDARIADRPALDFATLTGVLHGAEFETKHAGRFYTYVPMRLPGERPMALEVSESLGDEQRYVRSSILNNALTLSGIVFVCSMLAIALGYLFVGRPMSKLTVKARRIGAGDLTDPLVLTQHDEIAEFAVEMNAMCDRLAEAHDRIELEAAQKIEALEHLRHADRLRTVGQLASGLAHELGTPLNVVLGRARMILAGDATQDESSENARIIADQAQRMATLIRQLLDFARPRGPNFQNVDLRGIAGQTADMLGPLADKRHVKIEIMPGSGPVEADVDPTQIQQALTNLVVNATQAMDPATGGTVRIEIGDAAMVPPTDHGGVRQTYRCVKVHDDGAGIPAESLGRIFEPFFTTKGVGEGTGLGLSITYGIVRDHGGWIDVTSEPGKGSTFAVYLPPVRRESLPGRSRLSSSIVPSRPREVLPTRAGAG